MGIKIHYDNVEKFYDFSPIPYEKPPVVGGESGTPIEVATLPTPTEQDVGKVYLNTTDGSYYVGEQAAGGSLAVGEPLGDKINFDTSVNIADLGVPAGGFVPVLSAPSDSAGFGIVIGETLGGDTGTCYIVMCGDIYSDDPSSANIVYVQSDALTVDQFNEMFGSQIGLTITEFGWQTDMLDTSAFADCIVQENYLSEAGNFVFVSLLPAFEKANTKQFEGTIANLQSEKNILQNEKVALQEQYDDLNSVATVLRNSVTELYIPDGTTLEKGVLAGCNNIVKMSLPSVSNTIGSIFGTTPSSLKTVDIRSGDIVDQAFLRDTSLTELTLRDGVTRIGNFAFRECTGLTNIDIPDSVTFMGGNVFYACTGLTRVNIGNGVTRIQNGAFRNCTGLTDLTIGDGVTYIDNDTNFGAFRGCTSLKNLTIGKPVEIIYQTFHGCKTLTNVTITNGATSIDDYAFRNCEALTNVTIPDSVTSIGSSAFYGCSGLTSITIPNGVTSIGDYAFRDCTGLTDFTISSGVSDIGGHTFAGCTSLTNIVIPDNVLSIGQFAFYNCSGLTSVVIPDSVETIYGQAFCNCTSLADITIGSGVKTINDQAFYNCANLASITIKATTPPRMASIAFGSVSALSAIYVPAESVEAYKSATNWSAYTDLIQPIPEEQ